MCSLPKGDALSLLKGDALSLPKGGALNLPKGGALSLPKGWEVKLLSDAFDIKSSKRVHKADWKDNGIPFYRAREIVKLSNDGFVNNDLFISKELFLKYTKEKGAPKEGDLVISAVGTLGKCYLVAKNDKFYIKDASVLWFEKTSNIDGRFVDYAFKSDLILKQVLNKSMGATVGTLTITRAKAIQIPLPPLPEQKRIVAILEKAFTAINQAKANTEKNLKNARELFQSKLQETFANGKLKIDTGEWEEKKLGEVCDVRDGTHDSPKYINKGFALITSKNLKNDTLNYDKVKYISEEDYTNINKRSKVDVGDILFAMIGTIGNPVVIKNKPCFAIKNVALFKVPKDQDSYFFKYYLDSQYVIQKMQKDAKGATQRFVGLGYLRNFRIPLPPLPEQKQIVKKLDIASTETKKLETIYQRKITCLDELKKSILQKAFNGEL